MQRIIKNNLKEGKGLKKIQKIVIILLLTISVYMSDGGSCCIDINISNRYIYSKIPNVNLYINVYWCTDMYLLQSTFEKEI